MTGEEGLLLLHGGALGDLILSIQLCLEIAGARLAGISVISRVNPGDLSRCTPPVRRWSSDSLELYQLYEEPPRASQALVQQLAGADVINALGFSGADIDEFVIRECGARRVFGLDPGPGEDATRHVTRAWRDALSAQGLAFEPPTAGTGEQSLEPAAEMRERGQLLLDRGTRPLLVLHPGSGGESKNWPLNCFDLLAHFLMERGADVRIVIGPAEEERLPRALIADLEQKFCVLRGLSANDLACVLATADGFIGNDSGPTHLAALLGTPTLAIFGPTPAARWRPLGTAVGVLHGDASLPDWGLPPRVYLRAINELLRPGLALAES